MLKAAFNALIRIHSRRAQLKRLGNPDLYSPCRICPANYFRYLRGPEATVIRGREFIIPIDTILGSFSQVVVFDSVSASGTFKLKYNGNSTTTLNWNDSASVIQTALRLVAGLANVVVTGAVASSLVISFPGFQTSPLDITVEDSTLEDADTEPVLTSVSRSFKAWSGDVKDLLKRGDKLIDPIFGLLTVDEIVDVVNLGGAPMGFRARCE